MHQPSGPLCQATAGPLPQRPTNKIPLHFMTCHKAQGGQWRHVYYLSFGGYLTPDMIDIGFCEWLYTALTRAAALPHSATHIYMVVNEVIQAFIYKVLQTSRDEKTRTSDLHVRHWRATNCATSRGAFHSPFSLFSYLSFLKELPIEVASTGA